MTSTALQITSSLVTGGRRVPSRGHAADPAPACWQSAEGELLVPERFVCAEPRDLFSAASPSNTADGIECERLGWAHLTDATGESLSSWAAPTGGAPAIHVAVLDGTRCRAAPELFRHCAEVLELPEYFGHNWDAFDECVSDLLILDEGGLGSYYGGRAGILADRLLLVFRRADQLLAESARGELRVLLSLLKRAYPGAQGRITQHSYADLRVLFQCALRPPGRCAQALTEQLPKASGRGL
ncbi:barstar family protein [Saccharopolyspora sp. SCSIO 74807]|uniref:barstar family protein n=1 Tax=Saccharopolyspora sp. SCSIO 74807 TaxID=3118084 RepID=UPI0030D05460